MTATESRLKAGAAEVDITPELGTHLAGAVGQYRSAERVWDPLLARALVLRGGDRTLCFLALDTTIVCRDYTERIRQGAAGLGLEPEAVMVHATQTHSAPALGHFMVDPELPSVPDEFEWVRGAERVYGDRAAAAAIDAIRRANEALL